MAPAKLLGFLLLLFVCITFVNSGKTKKTIKIHVPYYVKHIHHYKKVYVPKVQVVKHEHLHKKEHEHHHHHDHGHHHHGYDKSSDGGYHEDYDSYYDDIDHRSFNDGGNRLAKSRQRAPFQRDFRDRSSSEELTSSEEEDYIAGSDDEGTLPAPSGNNGRFNRQRPAGQVGPKFRRAIIKRSDVLPTTASTQVYITPGVKNLLKRIVEREAS